MPLAYKNGIVVGTLDAQAGEPFFGFTYDSAYLVSLAASPISASLPLRSARYPGRETLPFFFSKVFFPRAMRATSSQET